MDAARRLALRALSGALTLSSLAALGFDTARGQVKGRHASHLGARRAFSPEVVRAIAKKRAAAPYRAPIDRHSKLLDRIGYDAHLQITTRRGRALWTERGKLSAEFFHLGNLFRHPVTIHVVEGETARELLYDRDMFIFGKEAWFADEIPGDLGFAGFRLHDRESWVERVAFLGASYFRAPGESGQYGLSARGVAVDTGLPKAEEFPRFTEFWLHRSPNGDTAIVYALLDGPSVAGAYRFVMSNEQRFVMDVTAEFFPRADVSKLGIAPITSMFWHGKHNRHQARDWRPQVHDSDGLALWTGSGEHIWRPLNNPLALQVNSFVDRDPKGFGLLQRDRRFSSYEDPGANYDKRPSLWVEPLDRWGAGSVELVELPTGGEYNDNIVAFWRTEKAIRAGSEWNFRYRLHWRDDEPYPAPLGRVTATRVGPANGRDSRFKRIVVDFAGGELESLGQSPDANGTVELDLSAEQGTIVGVHTMRIGNSSHWRGVFDFAPVDKRPVNIRGILRLGESVLTETWLYQFVPFD